MKSKTCNFCGTVNCIIKNGKTRLKKQRYKCTSCGKTFIRDSPTNHLRNSNYLFKKFIGFMIDDVTLEVIARNLQINIKTAHYYRYLVFNALRDFQDDVILDRTIIIDETFVPIREKEYIQLKPDGKSFRGISRNQLCIITMIFVTGDFVIKVASRGMALSDDFIKLFKHHIGDVKRFVHDGNTHQVKFMKQYDCVRLNWKKTDVPGISGDLVDGLHNNIKRYLFKHAGLRLKHMQHYMNFFCIEKTTYQRRPQIIK